MTSRPPALVRLAREFRRRRVFTTAGLYVVGAWLVMQAADVFFPGWGIPDTGINVLLIAAIVGFPLALVFGWFFNITAHGIRRTMPAGDVGAVEPRPLERNDYIVLGVLVLTAGVIVYFAAYRTLTLPRTDASGIEARIDLAPTEKLPNSIAVLPFDNISTDPENDVFSDGVSEEIRNRLGQYGELKVIARTSSNQFKGSDYAIPRISDLLGVRYLVKGSVRTQGDRIRVSAQLVADKGTQLWSKNYDRVLEDIFAIQDEIASLVATEVAPQVVANFGGGYKPSLDAYKHFVAGRDLLYRRDTVAAREELALAIKLDPDYAEAHAEYAISLLIGKVDQQDLQKADAAVITALDLAPDLPRALAARGLFLNSRRAPDLDASEAALREALSGDPNMVDAMNWLAQVVNLQGRQEEADEWIERAYALDPFQGSIATNMAFKVWEGGNPDRAEWILRRLVDLPEPPVSAIHMLSSFYRRTGRLIDANRMAKRLVLSSDRVLSYILLAENYAMLGQFQTATNLISATAEEYPERPWVMTGWMQAYIPYWQGEYDQATEEMRRARDASGVSVTELSPTERDFVGINVALSGDYREAVDMLAEWLPNAGEVAIRSLSRFYGMDAYQSLAWAYRQTGMPDMARQRLEIVEQWFLQKRASVETMQSWELYGAARNAVLMDDKELALDRLEQAVKAGWRRYYIDKHDPRWGALRNDPRYQALTAEVKADVDRQRAEVQRIDAEEDFQALLDEVRESRKSTAGKDSGDR